MISTDPHHFAEVLEALVKMKCTIRQVLPETAIILITVSGINALHNIKAIPGIIAAEEERDVSVSENDE